MAVGQDGALSKGAALPSRGAVAGLLLVLATAAISGVSTFVNGYAVAGTSSTAFVAARNAVVALLVLPVALVGLRPGSTRLSRRDWGTLVVIGLVGGAVPFVLYFQGLQLAAAAAGGRTTASFLYRILFVPATVLGVVVLRERFHWRAVLGGGLLLAGNFLLLSLTSPVWTDGSLLVLAATLLWAVEYTISKHLLRRLSSGTVAAGRMGFGAVFLGGYLLATSQGSVVLAFNDGQWTWVAISAALLAAFVGTWYTGLRTVDLGVASSVLVLGYPVTWALSIALGGGVLLPSVALGALVVLAGVAVVVGLSLWKETARWARDRLRSLRRPATS